MPSAKMLLATFMKISWAQLPWTWLMSLTGRNGQIENVIIVIVEVWYECTLWWNCDNTFNQYYNHHYSKYRCFQRAQSTQHSTPVLRTFILIEWCFVVIATLRFTVEFVSFVWIQGKHGVGSFPYIFAAIVIFQEILMNFMIFVATKIWYRNKNNVSEFLETQR